MKTKRGFTLVELLVVIAIISILAAIAVPNITKYMAKAKATRAQAEVESIQTSLVKMAGDAGVDNVARLFDKTKLYTAIGTTEAAVEAFRTAVPRKSILTEAQFDLLRETYTNSFYALLREGRLVLTDPAIVDVFDTDAVQKLGTNYMNLEFDPWGKMYQIFPGPWERSDFGNCIFRTYLPEEKTKDLPGQRRTYDEGEGLMLNDGKPAGDSVDDPDTGEVLDPVIGLSAPRDVPAFIYSYGQNLISGQALYRQIDLPDVLPCDKACYESGQEPILMGGGDDVNNWDKGASWGRFYN